MKKIWDKRCSDLRPKVRVKKIELTSVHTMLKEWLFLSKTIIPTMEL